MDNSFIWVLNSILPLCRMELIMIKHKMLEDCLEIMKNCDDEVFKVETEIFYKTLGKLDEHYKYYANFVDIKQITEHYQKEYEQIKLSRQNKTDKNKEFMEYLKQVHELFRRIP